MTMRVDLEESVTQGDVNSNLKCTTTVDSISRNHADNLADHLYKYKASVPIPPLGMVDDQISVSNCGLDSVMSTAHLNAQSNIKKLQFGAKKCHKMHVGKSSIVCPVNTIDTWKLEPKQENISTIFDLIDKEGEKYHLESVKSDVYLGDVLQCNAKNDINITERSNRGNGTVIQIVQMLEDLCLGRYFFEAALLLRNSMLLSTLLSNSESWYNLTKNDIGKLESTDEQLLRKIFSAPKSTPKELLYLESGSLPIRYILISRRLNFLWYILNQNDDSMLTEFLRAQCENPVKGDWILTVMDDLKELDIKENLDDIREISKDKFKKIVKIKVKEKAFKYLSELQETHSKSKNIKYHDLSLQEYLKPDTSDLSIKEKSFIFNARSRMLNVSCNFKDGKSSILCRKCDDEYETQEHLLSCKALDDNSVMNRNDIPSYEDIFGSDTEKIKLIGRILLNKFKLLSSDKTLCTDNIINHNNYTGAASVSLTEDMD